VGSPGCGGGGSGSGSQIRFKGPSPGPVLGGGVGSPGCGGGGSGSGSQMRLSGWSHALPGTPEAAVFTTSDVGDIGDAMALAAAKAHTKAAMAVTAMGARTDFTSVQIAIGTAATLM